MANYRVIKVTSKAELNYFIPQKKKYIFGFIPYWKSPNYWIGTGHILFENAKAELLEWMETDERRRIKKLNNRIYKKEVILSL